MRTEGSSFHVAVPVVANHGEVAAVLRAACAGGCACWSAILVDEGPSGEARASSHFFPAGALVIR